MLAKLLQWQKARTDEAGRADGFLYATGQLKADPTVGPRLLLASQDTFGEHGWWPFSEGIANAVSEFHAKKTAS